MVRIGRICILIAIAVVAVWFWNRKKKSSSATSNLCVVKYSYEDKPCQGNIVVNIAGKMDTLKELEYCNDSTRAIYMYAAGGDTITKDDVKKVFTLRNRGKVMTFNYPKNYTLIAAQ